MAFLYFWNVLIGTLAMALSVSRRVLRSFGSYHSSLGSIFRSNAFNCHCYVESLSSVQSTVLRKMSFDVYRRYSTPVFTSNTSEEIFPSDLVSAKLLMTTDRKVGYGSLCNLPAPYSSSGCCKHEAIGFGQSESYYQKVESLKYRMKTWERGTSYGQNHSRNTSGPDSAPANVDESRQFGFAW